MTLVTDPRQASNARDRDIAGILAAAAQGEELAWRRLVELYGRRVFALAKTRCGSVELAEEIAQSVFVTVASTLGRGGYVERGRFESWLFRVAMNRIRDEMRRRRRRPQAGEGEPWTRGRAAARTTPQDADSLRRAMGRLSEADRDVVELRHHGGMSFAAMAAMLNEPVGTLLARHHRALKKLRVMLEDEVEGLEGTER